LLGNFFELEETSKNLWINGVILLILFLLALMVRLPALGTFTTLDEEAWASRSRAFLAGLLDSNYVCGALTEHSSLTESAGLECTLRTGHPGVTTMWAGSGGIVLSYMFDDSTDSLSDYTRSLQTQPIDPRLTVSIRMPIAIWMSVWVIIVYWLVWRLFNHRLIALIAGLLLALDPFQIAHARVLHHDALEASFMTISLLTALLYWGRTTSRWWLVVSGITAGLAFLSKSPALFLVPFMLLLALWGLAFQGLRRGRFATKQELVILMGDLLLWFGSAVFIIVLGWPAMWIIPLDALRTVFRIGNQYALEGHVHYFLGNVSLDPGVLFYPVVWLLRSSPVVWLGILFIAGMSISYFWRYTRHDKRTITAITSIPIEQQYLLLMAFYVILFVTMMTFVSKKQGRYILPIFPIIDIIAAVGLVQFIRLMSNILPRKSSAILAIVLVVIIQGILVLVHYPYYFSYYNPVLGGTRGAEHLVTIGWGEGLDLAADYLNKKADAEQLKVYLPYYSQSFMPYFRGQQGDSFEESDYTIFYRNQLQRNLGDQDLWIYYDQYHKPEYIVNLHGVDYVFVYAVPLQHRIPAQSGAVDGKLILYGYRQVDEQPDQLSLQLVWRNQGIVQKGEELWLTLTPYPSTDQSPDWKLCRLTSNTPEVKLPKEGNIVESTCTVATTDLPNGVYTIHIGVGPSVESVIDLLAPAGELGVIVTKSKVSSLVTPIEALDKVVKAKLPVGASPLHISYGDRVSLIGYNADTSSSKLVNVTLFWQTSQESLELADLVQKFRIHFQLVDKNDEVVFETIEKLFPSTESGGIERRQKVLADYYQLQLPSEFLSGDYYLRIGLVEADSNQRVPYRNDVTGQLENKEIQLARMTIVE